ncbi:DEAD/DEAH box helicase [Thiotrichales bacterium 19S3-7]|nr:DEAD/DEAH box helicase [Thiotrichales bacterium 19S3-7]MCF6802095.1 DEAD/DEAH box helicase [Thiotrichales bacterium 19S3-11]
MNFASLGLSKLLIKALEKKGYTKPTPIQQRAIPEILKGQDIMASAQTGTGKTAAFTLPIMQDLSKNNKLKANNTQALILTPTRELAAQVAQSIEHYGQNLQLRSTVVFGGVKINPQMMKLRKGVNILVATPGRLLDLYQQNAIRFDHLNYFVLDEADRMLDMGFINDIQKIIRLLPKKRQNLMFSATFSNEILKLAKSIVNSPVKISVSPVNQVTTTVNHWISPVDKKQKTALLIHLIQLNNWQQVLVFTKTKHGANNLARKLNQANINADVIHGNKSQGARTRALANFKNNQLHVLVATDIAARGLDIHQLPQVVNYDLPHIAEDYVHRIGRTGRAGFAGEAISLVSADEHKQLINIERLTKKILKRVFIEGFNPINNLPASSPNLLSQKPKKPKKPKVPKSEHRERQKPIAKTSKHQRIKRKKTLG